GVVGERFGSTQISASAVEPLAESLDPVVPAAIEWPETDEERELYEHMLIEPAGQYLVADNYSLNQYGEIGLAVGDEQLVTPTEAGAPMSAEAEAQLAYNEAHSVILDDGATTNYLARSGGVMVNAGMPIPYLTIDTPVRVGAEVSFTQPVVVHYDFSSYRFQPTVPLTGDNPEDAPATFANDRETSPADVGGSLQIGTFNVLNYFTSLGEDYCTPTQNYKDRDGNPISANNCLPRGAWDEENLGRQQVKIVEAINALDTDIVSLEEIENSAMFGLDRDAALSDLVDALNAAAGTDTWAFVPSPSVIPETGDDVIRTAFIYQPATTSLDGESTILDNENFVNARAPLAQTFVDSTSGEKVVVIVNHFKSKGGSGSDDNEDRDDIVGPAGAVGGWNGDRTRQAEALVAFAAEQQATAGTDVSFLVGDFNAYSKETPVAAIEAGGFTNITATMSDDYSYLFGGTVGSLDHVFASDAALEYVTGADTWTINANEQIAQEYSRHNYNVVPLYDETMFRSSDHNPAIVGLQFSETPPTTAPPTTTPPTTPPTETTPVETTPGQTEPAPSEPTVSVPGEISAAALAETGLPVEAAGFAPGAPITVEVVYPDGTSVTVPFDDSNTTIPGADGTVAFTVWADGLVPAGDYVIVLTQGDLTASAEFVVTGASSPVATTPPSFGGGEGLAATGDDGIPAWGLGLGVVLVAAGALAAFGLRRRANA
ncbi:MAG: ExeM/NucH family extracellular endonuclease, partial [Pseudoclavibacter sp.]